MIMQLILRNIPSVKFNLCLKDCRLGVMVLKFIFPQEMCSFGELEKKIIIHSVLQLVSFPGVLQDSAIRRI